MIDKLFAWDGHIYVLAGIIFIALLAIMLPENALIPSMIAAAMIAMPLVLIFIVPYMLLLLIVALSLALLQTIATKIYPSSTAGRTSKIP